MCRYVLSGSGGYDPGEAMSDAPEKLPPSKQAIYITKYNIISAVAGVHIRHRKSTDGERQRWQLHKVLEEE